MLTNRGEALGGTEHATVNLTRVFLDRGWAVRFSFPCIPTSDALSVWGRESGFEAHAAPAVLTSETTHTLRRLLTLGRFIRASRPDVVNIHYGWNFIRLRDVLAARLTSRVRLVVTVHHPAPWKGPGAPYTRRKRRVLTGVAALLCDDIVIMGSATRGVLRQAGVPNRKIHLIHPGVQQPEALPSRSEARASGCHTTPSWSARWPASSRRKGSPTWSRRLAAWRTRAAS